MAVKQGTIKLIKTSGTLTLTTVYSDTNQDDLAQYLNASVNLLVILYVSTTDVTIATGSFTSSKDVLFIDENSIVMQKAINAQPQAALYYTGTSKCKYVLFTNANVLTDVVVGQLATITYASDDNGSSNTFDITSMMNIKLMMMVMGMNVPMMSGFGNGNAGTRKSAPTSEAEFAEAYERGYRLGRGY